MLQDTDTRATLPTPLLDAIAERHSGLRHVRLMRARGAKGHELTPGGSWTLHGEEGEPTAADEPPTDDPERIAEIVMQHAAEFFADNPSKDRRFRVELVRIMADGELDTKHVGFSLEEQHEAQRGGVKERAEAAVLLAQTDYIRQLHSHAIGLLRENSNAIRQVSAMLPAMVQLRFDALEDRAEAVLERGGYRKPDEQDPAWVKETGATLRTLLSSVAPQLASKLGIESDDAPAGSLRAKLRELGGTITPEQRAKIVGVAGIGASSKLMDAGSADTDEAAATTCQEALDSLGPKLDALSDVLTEKQRELLGEVFERIEAVVTAASSKSD